MAAAHEVPGLGMEAEIDGEVWRLGRGVWLGAQGATTDALELWFRRGAAAPVRFLFRDAPRPDMKIFVDGLKARGLQVHLLSGDRRAVATALAADLGIDHVAAEVMPADKVDYLTRLGAGGAKVLMVGDGLNDAPALAAAHVSVAPASAADAAQAAADFILIGAPLSPILEAIDVSRAARRRVLEGFGFSAVYNVIAIPFGAAGFVTPLIAAIAMSGSSIVVVLNALRLMGGRAR